jgi:hypothetical protein
VAAPESIPVAEAPRLIETSSGATCNEVMNTTCQWGRRHADAQQPKHHAMMPKLEVALLGIPKRNFVSAARR